MRTDAGAVSATCAFKTAPSCHRQTTTDDSRRGQRTVGFRLHTRRHRTRSVSGHSLPVSILATVVDTSPRRQNYRPTSRFAILRRRLLPITLKRSPDLPPLPPLPFPFFPSTLLSLPFPFLPSHHQLNPASSERALSCRPDRCLAIRCCFSDHGFGDNIMQHSYRSPIVVPCFIASRLQCVVSRNRIQQGYECRMLVEFVAKCYKPTAEVRRT